MKSEDFDQVRIILRGRAGGGITQADVQRRARELALFRTGAENYTAEDLETAELELMAGSDPAAMTGDGEAAVIATPDPSDPVGHPGEMYDVAMVPEENTSAEKPALQAVEEAQHDTVVEGHRVRRGTSAIAPRRGRARRQHKTTHSP